MNLRPAIFGALLAFGGTATADSMLEFLIQDSGITAGKPQPVLIKDGMLLVKGAGGDEQLDLLYSRAKERLTIIDHRKKTFMPVDEQQISNISHQTEDFMPLLQGLGEQMAKLTPAQRARWEDMLGGKVSLDKLANASKPQKPTSVVKTGVGRSVAGVNCEAVNVIQGKATMAEVCLAAPNELNLSKDDYATIRSLFNFSGNLAAKTHGFAEHFGVKIPNVKLQDFAGVPIQMRDLSGEKLGSLTLSRIVTSELSGDLMQIPSGYHPEKLSLWK
jgi:hypothetical protein